MATKVRVSIEDVGGSFARFVRQAPREMRAQNHQAVQQTAVSLEQRMRSLAPVGPDAPHIRDAITYQVRGTSADIGLLNATEPAAPGSTATMADVALYNEYNPNRQPFMRPTAEHGNREFTQRVADAMERVEAALSI